jgi:hypothetical protein
MGVLACSRKGCDNIMCNYYVPSIGYICCQCKEDFKKFLYLFPPTTTQDEVVERLKLFVETKGETKTFHLIDLEKFFEEHER